MSRQRSPSKSRISDKAPAQHHSGLCDNAVWRHILCFNRDRWRHLARPVPWVKKTTPKTAATAQSWTVDSAQLTVAVSPVMAPVMQQMASQFNSMDFHTPDDQTMTVWIEPMVPEKMVQEALDLPAFQAISPDSSLWLDQLEQKWATQIGGPGARQPNPYRPYAGQRTSPLCR